MNDTQTKTIVRPYGGRFNTPPTPPGRPGWGGSHSARSCQFPSWEGAGVGLGAAPDGLSPSGPRPRSHPPNSSLERHAHQSGWYA